jgi:uncharacterized membrane protein YGL010W
VAHAHVLGDNMRLNGIIEKLKPHWLSFIIASVILVIEQTLATLWVIYYLNLDVLNGDTASMAIQMFNWMNSDVNIFSKLYKLSQDFGILAIPVLFIGVYLYFLNRVCKVDDAHADIYKEKL